MRPLSLSRKGEKSDKNEDALLIMADKGLFVIADGVGGGPSGDFASRTLVEAVYQVCIGVKKVSPKLLQGAIQAANKTVFDAAQEPKLNGMATTVACALIENDSLITMHVGDSRVYRLTDTAMQQLTRDHTKQVQKADNSVKYVVTNALGIRSDVKIEVREHPFAATDGLVLVTDGVTDVVSDELLYEILNQSDKGAVDKLNQLMVACNKLGGRDDKTIVFCPKQ